MAHPDHASYSSPLPHELIAMANAYGARHVREFSPRLKTDAGRAVVDRLAKDPRVKALEGHFIWSGTGGGVFSIEFFAMWFLWLTERLGSEAAEKALDDYLNRGTNRVLVAQWVFGLEVELPVNLGANVAIFPAWNMPESAHREEFHDPRHSSAVSLLQPKCAIVCDCESRKTVPPGGELWLEPEIKAALRRVGVLPLLLNAFEGVSCVPSLQTTYPDEATPLGPFGGGGGGRAGYDVIGTDVGKLTPESAAGLMQLYDAYAAKPEPERQRLELILHRICQAKRHHQLADKVLDLGIALEMLLLEDSSGGDQISLVFRLRGSWLLGKNPGERQQLFTCFKDIYNARSKVAHTGVFEAKDYTKARAQVDDWLNLACRSFRKLLLEPKPNWSSLVLGA